MGGVPALLAPGSGITESRASVVKRARSLFDRFEVVYPAQGAEGDGSSRASGVLARLLDSLRAEQVVELPVLLLTCSGVARRVAEGQQC